MGTVTLPYAIGPTGVITATEIDGNINAIATAVNGNLDTTNIATGAGIVLSQLATIYEYMTIPLRILGPGAGGLTGAGYIQHQSCVPLYNDGKGNWTIDRVSWFCNDTGDGTAQIKVQFGYYTGTPTWTATDYTAAITLANSSGGAQTPNQGNVAPSVATLAFDTNQRYLGIYVIANGVGVINGATAGQDSIVVSVHLKRAVQAS